MKHMITVPGIELINAETLLRKWVVVLRHREDPIKTVVLGTVEHVNATLAMDTCIEAGKPGLESGEVGVDCPQQFELYRYDKATEALRAAADQADEGGGPVPLPANWAPERKKNA